MGLGQTFSNDLWCAIEEWRARKLPPGHPLNWRYQALFAEQITADLLERATESAKKAFKVATRGQRQAAFQELALFREALLLARVRLDAARRSIDGIAVPLADGLHEYTEAQTKTVFAPKA